MKYLKKINKTNKKYNWTKNNKCKDCGKIIDNRATFCKKHFSSGKRNYNYKHGLSNNPEFRRIQSSKYYYQNREKVLVYSRKYYKNNRKKIINYNVKYRTQKRRTDINIRIKDTLSKRIWDAVKGHCKSTTTSQLIGCSIKRLKQHLENQFKKDMSWKNYGYYGWHVDHIKPCVKFDLSKACEQRKCFNYKNLQPLWAKENMRKNGTF